MPNETRARALRLAETPLEQTPLAELRLLTGELYFLLSLGPSLEMALARWSSELTLLRARGLVERAQRELDEEARKAEAKQRERASVGRGRRGRRR